MDNNRTKRWELTKRRNESFELLRMRSKVAAIEQRYSLKMGRVGIDSVITFKLTKANLSLTWDEVRAGKSQV